MPTWDFPCPPLKNIPIIPKVVYDNSIGYYNIHYGKQYEPLSTPNLPRPLHHVDPLAGAHPVAIGGRITPPMRSTSVSLQKSILSIYCTKKVYSKLYSRYYITSPLFFYLPLSPLTLVPFSPRLLPLSLPLVSETLPGPA